MAPHGATRTSTPAPGAFFLQQMQRVAHRHRPQLAWQSWREFQTENMLIKSVYVHRDYTLEVGFNVSFKDFKTLGTECEGRDSEEPAIYMTRKNAKKQTCKTQVCFMVDLKGFEPSTSRMRTERSPN